MTVIRELIQTVIDLFTFGAGAVITALALQITAAAIIIARLFREQPTPEQPAGACECDRQGPHLPGTRAAALNLHRATHDLHRGIIEPPLHRILERLSK